MHEAVTSSPTINLPSSNPDDLQTPVSRRPRLQPTDLGWSQPNDDSAQYSADDWPPSRDPLPCHLSTGRRINQAGLQKKSFVASATLRADSSSSERIQGVGQRWRFNANGQLVDSDSANWDLADEIVRLKIGEVAGDSDIARSQVRTPAKSKLMAAAVAHINEASPLETSSSVSLGSSPHASENEISVSHSRGSSTDTTVSSSVNTGNDLKERPHSFSGGLSTADLRRLQQAGEGSELMTNEETLSYPSILNSQVHRPQPHPHPQLYSYQINQATDQDEIQANQALQPRNVNLMARGDHMEGRPLNSSIVPARSSHNSQSSYRQSSRGYTQQNVVATQSTIGYNPHPSHLSLGTAQQMYDMMLPAPYHELPAVARVQQQHGVYRPSHHHSASDPSITVRDTATMALLNGSLPTFPHMFQQAMYPYNTQEYPPRMQVQYPNQFSVMSPPSTLNHEPVVTSVTVNGQGPSANNRKLGLYKTELCRSWEEKGSCRYGSKCQFAHGEEELRKVARHPKYKTEICRTFWVSGTCPYGKRCCFIHTELPAAGGSVPGPGGSTTPGTETSTQLSDGRARSLSTNSDPNDANVSLLARITVKRNQDPTSSTTPTEGNSFQLTRPPTGSLRVDTSALDTSMKQNKSAYPSFASNGILLPAPEQTSQKLPGPVTAGPDLGRHNNARREIVGYNQRTHKANTSSTSSLREIDVRESCSPVPVSSYAYASGDGNVRPNGHTRTGSAGNWGNTPRNNQFSHSTYGTSSASEIVASSPWTSAELGIASSRINEKVWA